MPEDESRKREKEYTKQVNFKLTPEQFEVLERQRGNIGRSEYLRTLFTEKAAEEDVQQQPSLAVDLSKLEQLDVKFDAFQEQQQKWMRELQKLLETFVNMVSDLRDGVNQATSLVIRQGASNVAILQSLLAQIEQLTKHTVEAMKE